MLHELTQSYRNDARNFAKPVRIVLCIGSLKIGGTERHVLRLIKYLPAFGFQVFLVVHSLSGPLLGDIKESGICVEEISLCASLLGRIGFILKMAKFLRTKKIDIAQAFNDSLIFYVALAAKFAHVSSVVYGLRNTRFFARPRGYKKIVGWVCRNLTQGVITNSRATSSLAASEFALSTDRIWIACNGVPVYPDNHEKDRPARRKEMNLPLAGLIVGAVARLDSVKGIDTLVRAAEMLRDMPLHYLIVGDGNERDHLERLTYEKHLSDRFIFTGYQSNVIPWVQTMDIGVLCSRSEGLPQAILEYMACGLPVIAPTVGGVPELVVENTTGLLIPPREPQILADAIRKLVGDRMLRIEMGKAGQQRARQKFSLDNEIKANIAIYRRVFSETY